MVNESDYWRAAYRAIDARRVELGLSWRALYKTKAISDGTMRKMRDEGTPIATPAKRAALSLALDWPPDHLDGIVNDPTASAPVAPPSTSPAAVPADATNVSMPAALVANIVAAIDAILEAADSVAAQVRPLRADLAQRLGQAATVRDRATQPRQADVTVDVARVSPVGTASRSVPPSGRRVRRTD